MITIHFVQPDGTRRQVQAREGQSLMRIAIEANVDGIQADCGGCLSCATCHVYIEPVPAPPPDGDEDGMLGTVAAERRAGSRLSCQLVATPALDGATVTVPARQS